MGFQSQSRPEIGYIHFVGVSPAARGKEIGRSLYRRFFAAARERGCSEVRAITSPGNAASIAFHRRMGFALLEGDGVEEGVPVELDYSGPGQHRVRFSLPLSQAVF
ncbi:GNAT family N-acetyltransferase [Chromobacterium vaccinii]|uniref:GNAT family N-acetyltransferase n=1 Tax=Chromobacterium vaccinii TaxID=1108595 RepID=UPI000E123C7A|nr:GNAT family N-acetyltransferase [Chromobacterium vaccinii]SUX28697.1 Predicted acetyltransferase, GNAT superfamily [Chromobacterium vaccinii]